MINQQFASYEEFLARKDKSINGNCTNCENCLGCWNCNSCNLCNSCNSCKLCSSCSSCNSCNLCNLCSSCSSCNSCYSCNSCNSFTSTRNVDDGTKAICIVNSYKYICCPRADTNMIQMGCYIRSRKEWEDDEWNNPDEFPNNDSYKSRRRHNTLLLAYQWLDQQNEHNNNPIPSPPKD